MNYNVLKDSIAAVIKANGNEEITGDLLQQVLLSMVNILGSGYQFMGAAVPTTNPGTPDARVFYIATQAGTYANFGSPAIVLDGTQIAVLLFASSWTSVVLSVPTKEYVDTALALKVDKVEGKGLSTNDLTDVLVALIGGAFQKEDIAQDLGDSTTKVVSQAAITAVLLQYAKVDGYYAQLTAGAAENLVGRGSVPASFLRRTTGGTADVGTGSAKIAKLMGNSIVWNQLVQNGNFATVTWWIATRCAYTVSSNVASIVVDSGQQDGYIYKGIDIVIGHKYLIRGEIKANNLKGRIYCEGGLAFGYYTSGTGAFEKFSNISTASTNLVSLCIRNYDTENAALARNVMLIDLTKMFGAGKEPTTVAEFEALFPLPYYAYEPGKVLPFAAEKLVTTGFNQWDEEWEVGGYDSSTGAKISRTDKIRSTNKIRIFGGVTYFMCAPGTIDVYSYDISGAFLRVDSVSANTTFTPSANAAYIAIATQTTYGTTYKNDICINLSWSGYRNGEYEPYELHEAIFDPANWEDANGNKIFPYGGMFGFDSIRDFATPDNDGFIRKGTRVFGRVDMGTLDWVMTTRFRASVSGKKYGYRNLQCAMFLTTPGTEGDSVALGYISGGGSTDSVFLNIGTAESVEALQTLLSGVYLYYELETPVETELAEPVAASYYANDFGTEEWQPANTDEPYTAPCEMAIAYAANAVDTLRRLPENYISVGSFENFCTELATKLGAALNKTITIAATYDSETEEYDYAITIADIEG